MRQAKTRGYKKQRPMEVRISVYKENKQFGAARTHIEEKGSKSQVRHLVTKTLVCHSKGLDFHL